MCRLIIRKAHVRDVHITAHPIHSTASTTLSKIIIGKYGVLTVNGEDAVQEFMAKCMTCKKKVSTLYFSGRDE